MNTIMTMAIELPDTRSSVVMPAARNAIRTATSVAPLTATGVFSGSGVGFPGYVMTSGVAHVVDANAARNAKQASPPRGPSR